MADPGTSNDHKKQLELLHRYLDEDGWDAALQPPDQNNPYHLVVVKIYSDEDDNQALWNAEISFLPVPGTNLTDVSILQCFIPLSNNFPTLLKPPMYEMIARLNTKMPLVGFGFLDELNLLYYKHNIMLPNKTAVANGLILSESLSMITYLVSTFTVPVVEVAAGEVSVADAIDHLKTERLFS
ncbi:hypothetical protein [Mucilaginibacter sp.]|uniref:hypothetical protein n=1 Tax=Mucilaginibacter sp. TaxID=1882438 RepID=UPI00260CA633|nr:hypothetical protein [Mucilaginibacter sp.]MDB4918405.1 hypothetical protein [Mucilaginibacter sp.]